MQARPSASDGALQALRQARQSGVRQPLRLATTREETVPMKKILVTAALALMLAISGHSYAAICTIDDVPAATLLLPYFEVDLTGGPTSLTTLFSINNASASAAVAHVTVWTD